MADRRRMSTQPRPMMVLPQTLAPGYDAALDHARERRASYHPQLPPPGDTNRTSDYTNWVARKRTPRLSTPENGPRQTYSTAQTRQRRSDKYRSLVSSGDYSFHPAAYSASLHGDHVHELRRTSHYDPTSSGPFSVPRFPQRSPSMFSDPGPIIEERSPRDRGDYLEFKREASKLALESRRIKRKPVPAYLEDPQVESKTVIEKGRRSKPLDSKADVISDLVESRVRGNDEQKAKEVSKHDSKYYVVPYLVEGAIFGAPTAKIEENIVEKRNATVLVRDTTQNGGQQNQNSQQLSTLKDDKDVSKGRQIESQSSSSHDFLGKFSPRLFSTFLSFEPVSDDNTRSRSPSLLGIRFSKSRKSSETSSKKKRRSDKLTMTQSLESGRKTINESPVDPHLVHTNKSSLAVPYDCERSKRSSQVSSAGTGDLTFSSHQIPAPTPEFEPAHNPLGLGVCITGSSLDVASSRKVPVLTHSNGDEGSRTDEDDFKSIVNESGSSQSVSVNEETHAQPDSINKSGHTVHPSYTDSLVQAVGSLGNGLLAWVSRPQDPSTVSTEEDTKDISKTRVSKGKEKATVSVRSGSTTSSQTHESEFKFDTTSEMSNSSPEPQHASTSQDSHEKPFKNVRHQKLTTTTPLNTSTFPQLMKKQYTPIEDPLDFARAIARKPTDPTNSNQTKSKRKSSTRYFSSPPTTTSQPSKSRFNLISLVRSTSLKIKKKTGSPPPPPPPTTINLISGPNKLTSVVVDVKQKAGLVATNFSSKTVQVVTNASNVTGENVKKSAIKSKESTLRGVVNMMNFTDALLGMQNDTRPNEGSSDSKNISLTDVDASGTPTPNKHVRPVFFKDVTVSDHDVLRFRKDALKTQESLTSATELPIQDSSMKQRTMSLESLQQTFMSQGTSTQVVESHHQHLSASDDIGTELHLTNSNLSYHSNRSDQLVEEVWNVETSLMERLKG